MTAIRNAVRFAAVIATMMSVACSGSVLDRAINVANFAGTFANQAQLELGDLYEHDLKSAVDESQTREESDAKTAAVDAKYAPAWAALETFRKCWLATTAAIRTAETARKLNRDPNVASIVALVGRLTDAQAKFAAAVYSLSGGGK